MWYSVFFPLFLHNNFFYVIDYYFVDADHEEGVNFHPTPLLMLETFAAITE